MLGDLIVAGDNVRVRTAPGVELLVAGEPATEAVVASDADGEPTPMEHGSLLFYVIARGERLGVRLKDRSSPRLAAFAGMRHYPPAAVWRITGDFEPYDPPKIIQVPNILGTPVDETCPGRVVFEVAGERYEVVLDFNRAYNPPCVFTPWATCPLPPPQNRLSLAIPAGELAYDSAPDDS